MTLIVCPVYGCVPSTDFWRNPTFCGPQRRFVKVGGRDRNAVNPHRANEGGPGGLRPQGRVIDVGGASAQGEQDLAQPVVIQIGTVDCIES